MSVAPVLDVRGRNGREGQSTEQVLRPQLSSVQFNSVAQLCLTLCNPMNRSTPGLPIHHQLMEFTQTHVHRVSDAIQPSHPLSSLSPPAPNPSQHQSFPMLSTEQSSYKELSSINRLTSALRNHCPFLGTENMICEAPPRAFIIDKVMVYSHYF